MALDLGLTRKTLPDGTLTMRFPVAFRIALALLCALLAASMIVTGAASAFGVLLCLATLAGVLYTEQWRFDPKARTVESRRGLWPVLRVRSFPFASIENFTLHRRTNPRGRTVLGLSFTLESGDRIVVDSGSDAALESWAWTVSKTCRIPLGIEGEPPADHSLDDSPKS